ncbi:DUF1684 domain-containing protein [Cryobacterium tagatosivorans]|uniref:DUF1684 domain-containing protein n=1 Tax=Cryobacterium tagatosivorans TaxID=1259199 RepID=A0A4R8UH41_9MICO|nr:DUF1684 domain-containing protein [Cryobacterium tagatosivorans]TFB51325.1 DUF1684 domain-containing protein [Cryobacterium tagatosivorans]
MTDLISDRCPAEASGTTGLEAFRDARRRTVLAPQGNLALVNTQWITGDVGVSQPVWGVPGLWSPLPSGLSGLRLTAAAADGIRVDDELVDGSVIVAGMDALAPSHIRFSPARTGTIIADAAGGYALRVWDAESDGIRAFGSIDAFPYEPEWVIRASFVPLAGAEVSVAHVNDEGATRQKTLPREIVFDRDGAEYRLAAFPDGPSLLLVFGDTTNGVLTYSMGRFLRVSPGDDGTVILDFNRAYLPPCAFSYNFNCPIPPARNRFPIAIEAGERNVLTKSGELLH